MMLLTGLRGDSFLGFLAALGVCRTLDAPLSWQQRGPLWLAHIDIDHDENDVIDRLHAGCQLAPPPTAYDPSLDPAVKLSIDEWRKFANEHPEWAPALGTDVGGEYCRSPLLMSKGGGHQHPLTMVSALCEEIDAEDVRSALFGPWVRKWGRGLRLDPMEDRTHADAWRDPSKRSVESRVVPWGATRLAFEAFPLAPTLSPGAYALADGQARHFTWPLWLAPLEPRAVRAKLLTAPPWFGCRRFTRRESKGNWSVTAARPIQREHYPQSRHGSTSHS